MSFKISLLIIKMQLIQTLLLSEPPRFVQKLEDTYFKLRQPLTLKCMYTGSQRVYVTWKKDDKLIWASYKYNVKTTNDTLTLEVLNSDRKEAAGTYTCEISNDAGTDICHANVKLGKAYNNNIVGIDALRILLHQQAPL